MRASKDNLINGKISSHTLAMSTSKTLTAYKILQCQYVDDGAFPFDTREDLKKGMELVYHHFGMFGLEMQIGRVTSQSKTKCIFFPPPSSFNTHSVMLQLLQQSNEPFVAHTPAPAITQGR
jgi:hypothetical protein